MDHPGGGHIIDLGSRSPARSETASSSSNSNAVLAAHNTDSLSTGLGSTAAEAAAIATTSITSTLTTRYRRNGKLQSCEPCRKSKLRCDHTLPTCGRCIRRRCADKCVYHPAPMTQAARPPSPEEPPRLSSGDHGHVRSISSGNMPSRQRHASQSVPGEYASGGSGSGSGSGLGGWTRQEQAQSPLPKDPFNTINSNVTCQTRSSTYSPPSLSSPASSSSIPPLQSRLRPGSTAAAHLQQTPHDGAADNSNSLSSPVSQDYIGGATSFASVFSESLPSYGLAAELQCLRQFSTNPELGKAFGPPSDDAVMIEQCSRVLALFQDRSLINSLVDRLLEVGNDSVDIFAAPIIHGWLAGLWSVHGKTLASQEPAAIRELCVLLWRNTSTQITYDASTTPEEWTQAATGDKIRWEVLGIILSIMGDCCGALTSVDPIFASSKTDRVVVMRRASRGAKLCLLFCQDMSAAMDDLMLFLTRLLYNVTVATSTPSSFTAYQASGCMIDAVIAMGLHGPDDVDSAHRVPFFLTEFRKRAFASSYSQEVGLATFLGRPPRLSYRHCRFTPATGLTNHEILLPAEQRERLLTQLNPHGFRIDGVMNEQAFLKIWWTLSPRREDILDLSLCQYSPEEVLRRAREIEAQMEELWAILPESMRRARERPDGYDKITPFERLLHDLCRQAFRSNTLLLQRVVFQRVPGMSSDGLVRNAYHFLDDMLRAAQRPEMTTTYRVDSLSQLVFHGMRCGAILAVELLKREQLGSSGNAIGGSNESGKESNQDPAFSRGRTIRLLSVFVAKLSTVEVGEMWYHNCEQGTSLISRILDKVLDPQPQQQQQQQKQPPEQNHREQSVPQSTESLPNCDWSASAVGLQPRDFNQQDHKSMLNEGNEPHPPLTTTTGIPGSSFHQSLELPHLNSERDRATLVAQHHQPQDHSNFSGGNHTLQQGLNVEHQQFNNFPMPDVLSADPNSSEWAFDFPLDVPLLGNDVDLMQWFEAQSNY